MGGPGVAAMNGHAPGALRLAQEAVPDVCSAKEDAHCGAVQTLALCGSYLCSAGGDAMIRIWDASTLALFRCACHFPLLPSAISLHVLSGFPSLALGGDFRMRAEQAL